MTMHRTRHYGMGNYMRLSLHMTYGEVRGLGWGVTTQLWAAAFTSTPSLLFAENPPKSISNVCNPRLPRALRSFDSDLPRSLS